MSRNQKIPKCLGFGAAEHMLSGHVVEYQHIHLCTCMAYNLRLPIISHFKYTNLYIVWPWLPTPFSSVLLYETVTTCSPGDKMALQASRLGLSHWAGPSVIRSASESQGSNGGIIVVILATEEVIWVTSTVLPHMGLKSVTEAWRVWHVTQPSRGVTETEVSFYLVHLYHSGHSIHCT